MSSKVFIVTGASRGLGLAIAELLLRDSHKVFLVARSEAGLQKLKAEHPTLVEYMCADLGDLKVAPGIIKSALDAFGKLDGIIINHGVLTPLTKIADSDPEEWRRTYDINFISAVGLVKEAIPELRRSKGRIVLVSSAAAFYPHGGWGAYGTSKAAMNHLCAHLAVEEPDITSIAISPGKVDTGMQTQIREGGAAAMTSSVYASYVDDHTTGRLLKPEQPGGSIVKVAVDGVKELNGRHFDWDDAELLSFMRI